jgi:hypothetical protein
VNIRIWNQAKLGLLGAVVFFFAGFFIAQAAKPDPTLGHMKELVLAEADGLEAECKRAKENNEVGVNREAADQLNKADRDIVEARSKLSAITTAAEAKELALSLRGDKALLEYLLTKKR